MVTTILDELHNRGNLEWLDRSHKSANIIWRKPSGWAKELEKWVKATGRNNTVCTIYEIIDGEETEGETFHGIDRDVIMEALRYMEKHGKAEVIGDSEGVKFFCS
ncbi:Vacuolar protein-sorting-associated protein 25 [Sparganum proliferum]